MPAEEEDRKYRHSDEIETMKFRQSMVTEMAIFKSALGVIHDCIDRANSSFIEFKRGLGDRMDQHLKKLENHDDRLARIETSLAIMVKVTWVIVGCSVGLVMTAVFKMILR